ncbi:unnamed protein product [Arabidopsis halleri]
MISSIENERSELPSPKTLKLEEPANDEPQFPNYDSDDWETLSDDFRLLDEEWGKSGLFISTTIIWLASLMKPTEICSTGCPTWLSPTTTTRRLVIE